MMMDVLDGVLECHVMGVSGQCVYKYKYKYSTVSDLLPNEKASNQS
jgi:hypothetical protein